MSKNICLNPGRVRMQTKRVREDNKLQRTVSGGKPHSFTHSLIERALRTYYVPSMVLGLTDVKWTKPWPLL